jgi:hypothetical protein
MNFKKLHIWLIATLFLFGINSFAAHYRYGNVNWAIQSNNGTQSVVTFTITMSYSTNSGVGTNWSNIPVGGTINTVDRFFYGDGTVQNNMSYVVTSKNTTENWIVVSRTLTKTYNTLTDVNAYLRGQARVSGLQQGNGGAYYIRTIVSLSDPSNSPPSASTPPIFYVPDNQSNYQIQINANDPDNGDVVSFSWVPAGANGSGLSNPIPNIAAPSGLNTATGVITLNTSANNVFVGNRYATAIWISDNKGARVAVDFIIQIVGQSNPPTFDYATGFTPANGSVIKVQPGQTINFNPKASDTDPNSTITLSATGVPSGAVLNPTSNNGNPVTSSFNWVTSMADLGSRTVTFSAVDNFFAQTTSSVTLIVTLAPVFDVPPTPAMGAHNVVAPGTNLNFTVKASDPDPNDVCKIVAMNGKDMMGNKIPVYPGVTVSPSLPTPAGITTSLQFNWTPVPSQWGHKHVFFTAEDTYSDQTDHEVSILVNTVPNFTSTPVTSILSGQLYTYDITVNDPDVGFGDALNIYDGGLPTWLTLNDNLDGTATLSGTPTIADAGIVSIQLSAEDIHHHLSPIPVQSFSINVIPCSISITETITDLTCAGDNSGAIDIALTGNYGTPTFAWTGPNGFSANTEDVFGLEAGAYNLTVTSNLGCSESGSYTVGTTPDITPPNAVAQNLIAELDQNGNASILVTGNYNVGPVAGILPIQNSASVSTSQSCDCPTGSVAVGYEGFAGCITDNFRLICRELNQDGTLGAATAVTCFSGGGSTTPFSTSLSGNDVLVGFSITDVDFQFQSSRVHLNVVGHGKSLADISAGNSNASGAISLPGLNGGGCYSNNPTTTTQYAPDGHVIVGMDVNPNAYSSGVKFKYAQISGSGGLNLGSSDNCGIASLSASQTQFTCIDLGTNPVTLTVTDLSGNQSAATAIVTVEDNIAPTAVAQNQTIYLDASGNASIAATQVDAGSSDNCSTPLLMLDKTTFDCANVGTNIVSLTATDASGNSHSANATITVVDNLAPIAMAQPVTLTLMNGVVTSITPTDVDNGSSDNCGIASMSVSPNTFSCNDIGSNTVTLTVTDVNNISSTTTTTVDIIGVIPTCSISSIPANNTFTGGVATTLYLGYGAQSTTLDVTVSGGNIISYSWAGNTSLLSSTTTANPVFTPTVAGSETYIVTVTNGNGCTTTCDITIDVVDATCKNGKVLVCHNGKTICISSNAVGSHLSNHSSDYLGPCSSSAKVAFDSDSGFNALAYPSPYSDDFSLEIISDSDSPVSISLYDLNGKQLVNYNDIDPHKIPELGSNLADGVYVVRISQDQYSKTIKVTKN